MVWTPSLASTTSSSSSSSFCSLTISPHHYFFCFCRMPVNTCVAECAWNGGNVCFWGASCLFENVPLVEFVYFVFTCMLGAVTVGDSGLCCCVPCLSSVIISLCWEKLSIIKTEHLNPSLYCDGWWLRRNVLCKNRLLPCITFDQTTSKVLTGSVTPTCPSPVALSGFRKAQMKISGSI